MIDFLLSLSTWAGCGIVMGLTVVIGFVVYNSSYKFISKYKREDMKDSTANLFRVVGMLVSLMLALSGPFQSGMGVVPAPFEYLVETLQSEI